MRIRTLAVATLLALTALSASAIERWFPSHAKRGTASFSNQKVIVIDGVERQGGPGLRIWNTMGVIVFRTAVREDGVVINYTEDPYKLIDRIWILTPAEARKPMPTAMQQGNSAIVVTTPKKTIGIANSPTDTTVTIVRQPASTK